MDILPDKQHKVLLEHGLDVSSRKALADGSAMLVIDHAGRLVENFPAALPGEISKVGVFQIKGLEQFVKAAQFQKLLAVERAGSSASVKAGIKLADPGFGTVAHAQSTLEPPAFRQAGFFARLVGVGKED